MWRLIVFIIVFAVFLVFIVFNLENRCDISFGFAEIKEVPVFLTIFVSFILGLFCALPLVVLIKMKRKEKLEHNDRDKRSKRSKNEKKPMFDESGGHPDGGVNAS